MAPRRRFRRREEGPPRFTPGRSSGSSGSGRRNPASDPFKLGWGSGGSRSGGFNPPGDDDDRKPLGVEPGYSTPYQRDMSGMSPRAAEGWAGGSGGHGSVQERKPRYYEGDEWKPATNSPDSIAEIQRWMAATGLLSDFRYGIWDEPTKDAYKSLLGEANAAGLSAQQMLEMRAQSPGNVGGGSMGGSEGGGSGGGGGGNWGFDENGNPIWIEEQYVPPPLELQTTNKEDLKSAFRTAIIDKLGQGWNQSQIDEMVEAYNWKEIQVQKDAYDQNVALERAEFMGERAEGGEIISQVSVESPETFLENEMMERDPEGTQAGMIVNDMVPQFMQMMDGWA